MRQTNPAPHFPTQGILQKRAWTVILMGYRDHFPQVKYNNAVDQLERTSEKLQTAKVKCVEARRAAVYLGARRSIAEPVHHPKMRHFCIGFFGKVGE